MTIIDILIQKSLDADKRTASQALTALASFLTIEQIEQLTNKE